jgi:hypothetical protein
MSLTPAQAQRLDQLATAALDALRDQDRLAVIAATSVHDQADARANAQDAARRAQNAELRLFDAIHLLASRHPIGPPTRDAARRRWTAYLGI